MKLFINISLFWYFPIFLTRQRIAVLRFDDRGVGKSTGDHNLATTKDFASDVLSAIEYLKYRKDVGPIGLIGHSEGAIIAPMVANLNDKVSFVVMLGGTGISGSEGSYLNQTGNDLFNFCIRIYYWLEHWLYKLLHLARGKLLFFLQDM
jgi:uncharacterized protein